MVNFFLKLYSITDMFFEDIARFRFLVSFLCIISHNCNTFMYILLFPRLLPFFVHFM